MKKYFFLFVLSIVVFFTAHGQNVGGSPSFADNIIIHDHPDRNQQNVTFCTAFNGWMYAVYTYYQNNQYFLTMLKSIDNGVTWTVFLDPQSGLLHTNIIKQQLVAYGNTLETLKFFRLDCFYDSVHQYSTVGLGRYNGVTCEFEDGVFIDNSRKIKDIALAADNLFPATGSNPGSLAVVYSKTDFDTDSIIFRASSNGGNSFDSQLRVANSGTHYFNKVDISYGRSPSYSGGRYFVTWEEKDSMAATSGHIYTAHTTSSFSSPFSVPVRLDDFAPGSENLLSHPSISCQVNDADNDSSNLTEVILAEKYDSVNQKHQVIGFYNLQGASTSYFRTFSPGDSLHNNFQPDICFNPYDSTFMVTYFDSTDQKLPYLLNDFNLPDPDNWSVISAGYNNSIDISTPHPQVNLCYDQRQGAVVWSGNNVNGNGKALFDAPFHYYTGILEPNGLSNVDCKVFPNPAFDNLTFEFALQQKASVKIKIYNTTGYCLETMADHSFSSGKHILKFDISNYPAGMYYYTIQSGKDRKSGKIAFIN